MPETGAVGMRNRTSDLAIYGQAKVFFLAGEEPSLARESNGLKKRVQDGGRKGKTTKQRSSSRLILIYGPIAIYLIVQIAASR